MKCKKNNIIKKLSAVLTASALLLTGCSGAKSSTQTDQDLTYTDMLFDTVIKIQILDPADESILDGLKKLCEKYDTMFSTTNTDSELYKLNHTNGQPFTVSVSYTHLDVYKRQFISCHGFSSVLPSLAFFGRFNDIISLPLC